MQSVDLAGQLEELLHDAASRIVGMSTAFGRSSQSHAANNNEKEMQPSLTPLKCFSGATPCLYILGKDEHRSWLSYSMDLSLLKGILYSNRYFDLRLLTHLNYRSVEVEFLTVNLQA